MDEMVPVLVKTAAVWQELGALARFRRALRRRDQVILDHLLRAGPDQPGISIMRGQPVEVVLLRMLLEEQKELRDIQDRLCVLDGPNIGDG